MCYALFMNMNYQLWVRAHVPSSPKRALVGFVPATRQLHAEEEDGICWQWCLQCCVGTGGKPTRERHPWGFHPRGAAVSALSGGLARIGQVAIKEVVVQSCCRWTCLPKTVLSVYSLPGQHPLETLPNMRSEVEGTSKQPS